MSRKTSTLFLLGLFFWVAPVSGLADDSFQPSFWQMDLEEEAHLGKRRVGWASWYGGKFHGRKTANGERYNQNSFTCASRNLPFGTVLEVTNLKNGRSAVVRVNDRGPYRKNRILDLSYAVAKKLGFVKRGVAKVRYAVLHRPAK